MLLLKVQLQLRVVLYVIRKNPPKKRTRDKKTRTKVYARTPARETYLLRARCTSARETLHDYSSKACAQCYAGVFLLSRASRRNRRSCPKSRFATIAYPTRGREHERKIPGLASSALMPGTRWCKEKIVAISFEEGVVFRARVFARTLLYVYLVTSTFFAGFFRITQRTTLRSRSAN